MKAAAAMPSHDKKPLARGYFRGRGGPFAFLTFDVHKDAFAVPAYHASMYPLAISWSSVQPAAWYCSRVKPPAAAVIM